MSSPFCMPSCFSRVQLFATPWTLAHHSSVQGILEARILKSVAFDLYKGNLNTFLPSTSFKPQSYQESR